MPRNMPGGRAYQRDRDLTVRLPASYRMPRREGAVNARVLPRAAKSGAAARRGEGMGGRERGLVEAAGIELAAA